METRYYWRVRACASTCSAWSETRSFVTQEAQVQRYYPFGLQMPQRSMETPEAPKERFTGHELDDETGLLYAGARYLDPVIGRWMTVDPQADRYPSLSPYTYVFNNPLIWTDPDGECPDCWKFTKGYFHGTPTRSNWMLFCRPGRLRPGTCAGSFGSTWAWLPRSTCA